MRSVGILFVFFLFSCPVALAKSFLNDFGLKKPETRINFDLAGVRNGAKIPETKLKQLFGISLDASPMTELRYQSKSHDWPHIKDGHIVNFFGSAGVPLSIKFGKTYMAFAIAISTPPREGGTTTTVTAKYKNKIVEKISAPTSLSRKHNFFGFTGIEFNEIHISADGKSQRVAIDNMQLIAKK